MLNLIAVSSSAEAAKIVDLLQPMLRIKVDVLTDVDQALQDILSKKPSIVCVEKKLPGITAESFARHIQMLLGFGAPSFVLMHAGDSTAKPVKGVFEYLLDLSLPKMELEESARNVLKTILGYDWDSVCVPLASSRTTDTESDPFIEDFFSAPVGEPAVVPDQKKRQKKPAPPAPSEPDLHLDANASPFQLADSLDELLVSMQAEQDKNKAMAAPDAVPVPPQPAETRQKTDDASIEAKPVAAKRPRAVSQKATALTDTPAPKPMAAPASARRQPEPPPSQATSSGSPAPKTPHSAAKAAGPPPLTRTDSFRIPDKAAPSQPPPQNTTPEYIKDFQLPHSNGTGRIYGILLVIAAMTAGGWYLTTQKQVVSFFSRRPIIPSSPGGKPPSPSNTAPAPSVVQGAVSSTRPSSAPSATKMPTFIPVAGRDAGFSKKNPGWERYTGTNYECRIFKENGRIKAIQVLAVKQRDLDQDLMKKMLREAVGSDGYRVTSQERSNGYLVQRCSMDNKADLMIYMKSSRLHAFVVSLN